jgi:hypothetical protein
MAAFAPSFTAVQSSDGTLITITDTSPWGGVSDENYPITGAVRSFELTDSVGDVIETIDLDPTQLVGTYEISTNKWIQINFVNTGTPAFNIVHKFAFYRIFQLAYMELLKKACGCKARGIDICSVDAFLEGALMAEPIGNGVAFQDNIDSAYAYLIQ